MKVCMSPSKTVLHSEESGIKRVVEAYLKHLPTFGVEFVEDLDAADVTCSHIDGTLFPRLDVFHSHGLYWTADYNAENWQYAVNAKVIAGARRARVVTVPSSWVAEPFQRDMRLQPKIVGHGIEWAEWHERRAREGYVLWNKNRSLDVCDPTPVRELAQRFPRQAFVTTFYPKGQPVPHNVKVTGVLPHSTMANMVKASGVYLATTKETFGIGILEAMASGVPVLGFRHGGAVDLVRHGVNGYLSEPGNYDDLAAGLVYCLEHAAVLGGNGRELARAYTWERVAEQVYGIYQGVITPEPPTVGVVIPCFNYGTEDKLGRAIESVLHQNYDHLSLVVVVDDGSESTDGAARICGKYNDARCGVRYIHQERAGVAVARNRGIGECHTQYVICLDADDAVEPDFLQMCVRELEADRSLGIAYTRLRWVTPDGKTSVSDWPGDCDPDQQMAGHNQIPTCCVFRRDMWERLGGYNSRYCPSGAGEEDAEFWLRAMAHGWGAKRAGEEALFVYSQGSGQVSGNKKHREMNWKLWHPWTRDGLHPFASQAKPKRQSHPVRQYDRPEISIVIPVGPGHEREVRTALESLEAQDFRAWEAIVVIDQQYEYGKPPIQPELKTVYPYVHWWITDGKHGSKGSGHARNRGAEIARAPLLLFLDADDYLVPEALSKMMQAWRAYGMAVYTDYVGVAFVDDVTALAPNLQDRIYERDESDGRTVIGYQAFDYDCERAQRQPEEGDPYLWNLVTTLHPKAWWVEVGGMDESLKTWEDVDYWWRLARRGKCFVHLTEELVVYQFGTGHRRAAGVSSYAEMLSLLKQRMEKTPIMACGSCGQKRAKISPPMPAPSPDASARSLKGFDDKDFVLCLYTSANQGQHPVVGGETKIRYGYRAGGDIFLVHARDIAVQPHLFLPAPEPVVEPPTPPPAPTALSGVVELEAPTSLVAVEEEMLPKTYEGIVDYDALPGVTPEIVVALRAMFGEFLVYDKLAGLQADELFSVGNMGTRKARQIIAYAKRQVKA